MRGVEGSQLVDNDNSLRLLGFVDDHRELFSRHSQCIKEQNHEMASNGMESQLKIMELISSDIDPQQDWGLVTT